MDLRAIAQTAISSLNMTAILPLRDCELVGAPREGYITVCEDSRSTIKLVTGQAPNGIKQQRCTLFAIGTLGGPQPRPPAYTTIKPPKRGPPTTILKFMIFRASVVEAVLPEQEEAPDQVALYEGFCSRPQASVRAWLARFAPTAQFAGDAFWDCWRCPKTACRLW